jgi:hypothetical protein
VNRQGIVVTAITGGLLLGCSSCGGKTDSPSSQLALPSYLIPLTNAADCVDTQNPLEPDTPYTLCVVQLADTSIGITTRAMDQQVVRITRTWHPQQDWLGAFTAVRDSLSVLYGEPSHECPSREIEHASQWLVDGYYITLVVADSELQMSHSAGRPAFPMGCN